MASALPRDVRRIAVVVIVGAVMSILDTTIVNVALATLRLDLNALANGDTVEVRGYTKVRSSDSIRQEFLGAYSNVQTNVNKASTPLVVTAYGKFTVKQTAGTGRAVPWVVMQL